MDNTKRRIWMEHLKEQFHSKVISATSHENKLVSVVINEYDDNIIEYKINDENGGWIKIFDASGCSGAFNFYDLFKKDIHDLNTEKELVEFVYVRCRASGQFSFMGFEIE